jgi:putative nucleotidyltransferase with HDIG domain
MSAASSVLATNSGILKLLNDREQLLTGVLRTLVNALDAKDSYTCGHSDRVAEFARLIAQDMGVDEKECEQIHLAGLLHDIGKVGIPDQILNKTSAVTELEMERIRQHPTIGYEILKHLSSFEYVLPGVLHHHESFDGTGYPHGLSGASIPLSARILAVADAWDAMTSDRPYRVGMPPDRATSILNNGSGRQWDPQCVTAFLRCMDAVRMRMDLAHSTIDPPRMMRSVAVASISAWPQPFADAGNSSN